MVDKLFHVITFNLLGIYYYVMFIAKKKNNINYIL